MLQIPSTGFARSVGTHNGRLDIQADWVEASAMFAVDTVSRSDMVDALIENNSYATQDFANDWVDTIFEELSRRFEILGDGGTLVCEGKRIRRVRSWTTRPAYAFCVVLGAIPRYREYVEAACGADYTQQGALFERLCEESLRALHWEVHRVGWSRGATNDMSAKVHALSTAIGEPATHDAISRWTEPQAKDGGLDLIAWKKFPDGWGGRPICLFQCASGEDWTDKLHTPPLALWTKLIDFATQPRRGLTMPFAPEADFFRRKSNTDLLMYLLDRHRLLSPTFSNPTGFPCRSLSRELNAWSRPRVRAFPRDDK
jgi:hypothetical protein